MVFVYEAADTGLLKGDLILSSVQSLLKNGLVSKYGNNLKIGCGTFVDKPRPSVGVGSYGGYPEDFITDWCWTSIQKLTNEWRLCYAKLPRAGIGAGMDELNGVFDAIALAATDQKLNWSKQENIPTNPNQHGLDYVGLAQNGPDSSDTIEKFIIVITDSFGRSGEFCPLSREVEAFNTPVRCETIYPGAETVTAGGFRAKSVDRSVIPWYAWANYRYESEFRELQELLQIRSCKPGGLDDNERQRFNYLNQFMGPTKVPEVEPFDYDRLINDTENHCRLSEYPRYDQIVKILYQNRQKLIIVYAGPDKEIWPITVRHGGEHIGHTIPRAGATIAQTWEWTMTSNEALGDIPNVFVDLTKTNYQGLEEQVLQAIEKVRQIPFKDQLIHNYR